MDRFYRGVVAGIAGGIVMNVWSYISYHILHFSTLRFLDWASVIMYGHFPRSTFEMVYALIIQLFWVSLLGVLFVFLIPTITSRGYLGKGMFYGLTADFLIYSIPKLFKIPQFEITPLNTVISNHIGGIIWGLIMAYVLQRLDTTRVNG